MPAGPAQSHCGDPQIAHADRGKRSPGDQSRAHSGQVVARMGGTQHDAPTQPVPSQPSPSTRRATPTDQARPVATGTDQDATTGIRIAASAEWELRWTGPVIRIGEFLGQSGASCEITVGCSRSGETATHGQGDPAMDQPPPESAENLADRCPHPSKASQTRCDRNAFAESTVAACLSRPDSSGGTVIPSDHRVIIASGLPPCTGGRARAALL